MDQVETLDFCESIETGANYQLRRLEQKFGPDGGGKVRRPFYDADHARGLRLRVGELARDLQLEPVDRAMLDLAAVWRNDTAGHSANGANERISAEQAVLEARALGAWEQLAAVFVGRPIRSLVLDWATHRQEVETGTKAELVLCDADKAAFAGPNGAEAWVLSGLEWCIDQDGPWREVDEFLDVEPPSCLSVYLEVGARWLEKPFLLSEAESRWGAGRRMTASQVRHLSVAWFEEDRTVRELVDRARRLDRER